MFPYSFTSTNKKILLRNKEEYKKKENSKHYQYFNVILLWKFDAELLKLSFLCTDVRARLQTYKTEKIVFRCTNELI